MPITKLGQEMLRNFHAEYGRKRGNAVFYAYMNKYPKRTKGWHNK